MDINETQSYLQKIEQLKTALQSALKYVEFRGYTYDTAQRNKDIMEIKEALK